MSMVVFGLMLLAGAVAATALTLHDGLAYGIALTAMMLSAGSLLLRYAIRSRIVLTDEELAIYTLTGEHHLAWPTIIDAQPGYYGVAISRTDGPVVLAGAVQKPNYATWMGRTNTPADRLSREITRRAGAADR